VDRKKVDSYFHKLSSEAINMLPNNEKNYLLYMVYKIDGRYYLFDHELDINSAGISANDTIEMQAQKLFDAYKDTELGYGISPIPKTVVLNGVTKQGNLITLDFTDSFLNAYKDREDLKQMMVESLAY